MKYALLTTTALVAFASAASAQESGLSFTGDAELGYTNDSTVNNNSADNTRFFFDAQLDVNMTTMLDNGLTASVDATIDILDGDISDVVESEDFILSLFSETANLQFGDLDPVAEDRFNGVDGASVRDFADQDAIFAEGYDAILIGEATFGAWTTALSFGVNADAEFLNDQGKEQIDGLEIHIAGSVSIVDIELVYQDDFFLTSEDDDGVETVEDLDAIYGFVASATVANADLALSFLDDGDENSIGLSIDYPFGPITVGGYYSINDIAEDNYGVRANYALNGFLVNAEYNVDAGENGESDIDDYLIEGSYQITEELELFAGYLGGDDQTETYYAAGEYDLGGGAEILISYADDGDSDSNVTDDAVGDPEYNEGASIILSVEF